MLLIKAMERRTLKHSSLANNLTAIRVDKALDEGLLG